MTKDHVLLKPNEKQRETLEYLKLLVGLKGVHGEDQKTIYWALDFTKQVIHLFSLDKLLKFKGFQSQEYEQFKSERYKNVGQNAKKSIPISGEKVDLEGNIKS
ncbi:hypothetical protein ES702_04931 [subsurface metagenome]